MSGSEVDWSGVLDSYLSSQRAGALIVTGGWGSGKTHLYRNQLSGLVKARARSVIYVSLYAYGVQGKQLDDFIIEQFSGVDDIDDGTKSSALSIFSSVFTEFAGKSPSASAWGAVAQAAGGVVKKRIMAHLSNHILCLDDVDRIDSAFFEKAWAEINYYAEYKKQKIILLVDESRLPGKSVRDPRLEKNVWGVYSIQISTDNALEHAFSLLSRDQADLIEEAKARGLFKSVVDELDIKNIRSIHAALEHVSRLATSVLLIEGDLDNEALLNLYQLVFLVYIISPSGFENPKKIVEHIVREGYGLKVRASMSLHNNLPLTPEEEYVAKLPHFNCMGRLSFGFVYDYWDKNILDEDQLKEAVEAKFSIDHSNDPLYDFYASAADRSAFDDEEYRTYIEGVREVLARRPAGGYHLAYIYKMLNVLSYDQDGGAFAGERADLDAELSTCLNGFHDDLIAGKLKCFDFDDYQEYMVQNNLQGLEETSGAFARLKKLVKERALESAIRQKVIGWEDDPCLKALREVAEDQSNPVMNALGKKKLQSFLAAGSNPQLELFLQIIVARYQVGGIVHGQEYELEFLKCAKDAFTVDIDYGYRRLLYRRGLAIVQKIIEGKSWSPSSPSIAFE